MVRSRPRNYEDGHSKLQNPLTFIQLVSEHEAFSNLIFVFRSSNGSIEGLLFRKRYVTSSNSHWISHSVNLPLSQFIFLLVSQQLQVATLRYVTSHLPVSLFLARTYVFLIFFGL